MKNPPRFPPGLPALRQGGDMSLLHCPLCIGLAVLSVVRAASHLALVSLRLVPLVKG